MWRATFWFALKSSFFKIFFIVAPIEYSRDAKPNANLPAKQNYPEPALDEHSNNSSYLGWHPGPIRLPIAGASR